jgi:hypothetical protein
MIHFFPQGSYMEYKVLGYLAGVESTQGEATVKTYTPSTKPGVYFSTTGIAQALENSDLLPYSLFWVSTTNSCLL